MFNLDEQQRAKLNAWIKEQDDKAFAKANGRNPYGCTGGAYSYVFTPTTIGLCVEVKNCVTGETINLTDYDSW